MRRGGGTKCLAGLGQGRASGGKSTLGGNPPSFWLPSPRLAQPLPKPRPPPSSRAQPLHCNPLAHKPPLQSEPHSAHTWLHPGSGQRPRLQRIPMYPLTSPSLQNLSCRAPSPPPSRPTGNHSNGGRRCCGRAARARVHVCGAQLPPRPPLLGGASVTPPRTPTSRLGAGGILPPRSPSCSTKTKTAPQQS